MKRQLIFSSILVLALPLIGSAQTKKLQPNERETNIPGVTTIIAPPEGFDPISASDEDLSYYGFPPRPSQVTEPKAYATWTKAMKASKTRVFPRLEQTSIFHRPRMQTNPPVNGANATTNSYNSSGFVNLTGATEYGGSSIYYTVSYLVVPVAQQALGTCSGGWDYGTAWTGIDGFGSPDVLQGGIEFDAYCAKGSPAASFYSVWYEWYPNAQVRISSPRIVPGDDIFVEVWHTTPTQGYMYVVNVTTNSAVTVGFTAPTGTSLVGNSVEWILERPYLNGSPTTLTNYTYEVFWDGFAYSENYDFYLQTSGTSIKMVDSSGNTISYLEVLGPEAFLVVY